MAQFVGKFRPENPVLAGGLLLLVLIFLVLPPVIEKLSGSYSLSDSLGIRKLGLVWLENNLNEKGLFVYQLEPQKNDQTNNNNELRQLMASRVLAEESKTRPELLELHKRNLEFVFKFWYKTEGDIGYIFYDQKSKLGGNAMLLRTLVYSPLYKDYAPQAKAVANGLLSLQNASGSFNPWLIEPDYAYDKDYLLTFYSGEALLALGEYYEIEPDADLLAKIEKSADFYIDRYVVNLEKNYYPAYVPWHTQAYHKLYKLTGNKKYLEPIFILNDKLLELLDKTDQIGRFYNPKTPQYGSPHSSSDAVYLESFAYAHELALEENDETRIANYREAIDLALENLKKLQYREVSAEFKAKPERYIGSIRVNNESRWIRVDTTQHAVDATKKLIEVLAK